MAIAIVPDLYVLDVRAANGVPFRVLAIPGWVVGPNRYRAPADRAYALVEFYDRRYLIDGEHGQFTGAYYDVSTVLDTRVGLNLHGGVDAWTVDAETMDTVRRWLSRLLHGGALNTQNREG